MDKTANRRQLGPKTTGEGTTSAVMEPQHSAESIAPPPATGKMPGEGMYAATIEAPSGNMPGRMQGAPIDVPFGQVPGVGMLRAAIEAESATGKMPGEGLPAAGMRAPSVAGKMPNAGMPGATIGAPFLEGKMPGETAWNVVTGAVPARMPVRKTAREEKPVKQPHVLVKPGESLAAAQLAGLGPYTKRGSTANFDAYYDNGWGTTGRNLADAVLANCEWDLLELRGWFGGVTAGRFSVYIDPGSFGAYHADCAATELHLAVFGGTDGALENMLNVAEADEVMMANQGAGWNCGASAGEGLSRVLATQRYPSRLDGFAPMVVLDRSRTACIRPGPGHLAPQPTAPS